MSSSQKNDAVAVFTLESGTITVKVEHNVLVLKGSQSLLVKPNKPDTLFVRVDDESQ
jgi:hypothetical protein